MCGFKIYTRVDVLNMWVVCDLHKSEAWLNLLIFTINSLKFNEENVAVLRLL